MGTDAFPSEDGELLAQETAQGLGGGYLLVFEVEEAVLLQDEPSLLPVLANMTYKCMRLVIQRFERRATLTYLASQASLACPATSSSRLQSVLEGKIFLRCFTPTSVFYCNKRTVSFEEDDESMVWFV
jgi:hypothetical protein